jgi:hypothetical protein
MSIVLNDSLALLSDQSLRSAQLATLVVYRKGQIYRSPHRSIPVAIVCSVSEEAFLSIENAALIREKAVLLRCLETALGLLDERSSEQVRDIYRERMKEADLVSLTKPEDLVPKQREMAAGPWKEGS